MGEGLSMLLQKHFDVPNSRLKKEAPVIVSQQEREVLFLNEGISGRNVNGSSQYLGSRIMELHALAN